MSMFISQQVHEHVEKTPQNAYEIFLETDHDMLTLPIIYCKGITAIYETIKFSASSEIENLLAQLYFQIACNTYIVHESLCLSQTDKMFLLGEELSIGSYIHLIN